MDRVIRKITTMDHITRKITQKDHVTRKITPVDHVTTEGGHMVDLKDAREEEMTIMMMTIQANLTAKVRWITLRVHIVERTARKYHTEKRRTIILQDLEPRDRSHVTKKEHHLLVDQVIVGEDLLINTTVKTAPRDLIVAMMIIQKGQITRRISHMIEKDIQETLEDAKEDMVMATTKKRIIQRDLIMKMAIVRKGQITK